MGISQYLATAANAFDHAVKRRVLAIDRIVRITREVLLRGDRPAVGGGRPVPPAAIACPQTSRFVQMFQARGLRSRAIGVTGGGPKSFLLSVSIAAHSAAVNRRIMPMFPP